MALSGILNVNKPPEWTSFDVVRFVRGRCGQKRVGHAGTLDPAATGVLPVFIGQSTRLVEYLVDSQKVYLADIQLGVSTDTYDAEGEVLTQADASGITETEVRKALGSFVGSIMQAPPVYSAIKRDGVPLYKRARRGEDVRAEPRPVRVDQLDIIATSLSHVRVRIVCGKGFYVRSLAHDLGAVLGVGGMLQGLVRERVGTFNLSDAVDIETLRREFEEDTWQDRLVAPDEVLLLMSAAILGEDPARDLVEGREAVFSSASEGAPEPGKLCRAYNDAGEFFAVLRCQDGGVWRPEKVFAPTSL